MKRIKENAENECEEIVSAAWDDFSDGKHRRPNIIKFEAALDIHLRDILAHIKNGSFFPQGYTAKIIHERKTRLLAKAPVYDHVAETAVIYPYQQEVYDRIVWQSPAVRPGLGNHALLRFLRNDLFSHTQQELYYNFSLDIHHYFPLMDHSILKQRVDRFFKPGKVRDVLYRVIDSYLQGIPLGIKIAQLFGMMYLSDFDRLCLKCFNIRDDPDKLAYWTQRFITVSVTTAKEVDYPTLSRGTIYLTHLFHRYLDEGLQHYYRFVDNIIIMHENRAFLHIMRDLVIVSLTRDYHCTPNRDHSVRPTYLGIHIGGYVFYHEKVLVDRRNKQNLARKVKHLFDCGADEEDVRRNLSSYFGFVKHANSTNLIKSLGMDKSLGKIIKKRRVKAPFAGLTSDDKVKFSELVSNSPTFEGGANWDGKLLLLDYCVQNSKIDKSKQVVSVQNSDGEMVSKEQDIPEKVLAFKFKKVVKTFVLTDSKGEEIEQYQCIKKKDANGEPTDEDAVYYCWTGSKIMIDQALNDFTQQDLPCPTYIIQEKSKSNKFYTKFS